MKKYKRGYMAGVYDLFHIGHLNLINRAKENCEYLIVGVLTDELVYHFKKKYPVIPFVERSAIIAAIKGVDEVIPVTLENVGKMQSWNQLHYDVQFSGSDYENAPDWLADKKRLEEVGSTIMFFPYTQTTSSTDIRTKLLASLEAAQKAGSSAQKTGYVPTEKQKQVWNVELNMLDFVDKVCKKHKLKYFAVHGTLLGAVRHKGFIPWDDDLDIAMLRKDYDKFLEVAKKELPENYSLQTMFSEKNVFYNGHAKLRDSNTTALLEQELDIDTNKGIWIDIIPIDNSPIDDKQFRKKSESVGKWNRLMYTKVYGKNSTHPMCGMTKIQWMWSRMRCLFLPTEKIAARLNAAMKNHGEVPCELGVYTGYTNHRQLNAKDFEDVEWLEFQGRKISAPKGYKNYLFMVMGSDYMKFPPENEQKPKNKGIFDATRPYTDYEKLFCKMFEDAKGKKVILFGAGMMFDNYMERFGRKYRPAFIVDNDKNKWGRYRQGVEIKPPQDILSFPVAKRKVIICSAHYLEIEKQLMEMGVADYSVYVQKIEWITDTEKRREG